MAMTRANSAIASVSAKPSSTLPNTLGAAAGLRSAPETKLPKMLPIPTPTPASAMVANPAPINFAASASIVVVLSFRPRLMSVMHMHRIVEIDAGENREHIGLQHRDADLQAGERDGEGEGQDAADDANADQAERAGAQQAQQGHDKAAEHLQHGMTSRHV